ncbi:MAG TPA: CHAT domain-containing protein [Kofleriaceae bacterium]|jgi:hypothetical protein|nr:CHAT domain-containing protein [Kofleriaceae bacterium]
MSRRVVVGLNVMLPDRPGDALLLQRPGRAPRQLARTDPPPALRSDAVWARLQRERLKSKLLDEVGAQLADWLFGEPGVELLAECSREYEADETRTPRRIALYVPDRLAGWPWEAAFSPALRAPIGVDDSLVVVRMVEPPPGERPPSDGSRSIVLVGVELAVDGRAPLATVSEVEAIRQALARFEADHVELDVVPRGTWTRLLKRVEAAGPPTVLHFAGHGDGAGEALVFRGDDAAERVVDATRVCELLTRGGHQARLVVLNACRSAAGEDPALQPFGSLAQRLVKHGVAAVVGHQVPIADTAASEFASELYTSLADGALPDAAAHTARARLFSGGVSGAEWPFVVVATRGEAAPVFSPIPRADPNRARLFHAAAFDPQRAQLEQLILARRSFVAVVYGAHHAGHRFVIERARADLAASGQLLWKPVPEMRWLLGGDPRLDRTALLGAIAETAGIEPRGSDEELEAQIVAWIRDCCAERRTLVLDVADVCITSTGQQAEAIVEFVVPLWSGLVHRAGVGPTVLLLAIGYPGGLPAWLQQRRARKAVAQLRERRPDGDLAVRILDELRPISRQEVAAFIADLGTPPELAQRRAAQLVAVDNEHVLQHLHRLLQARNPA